MKLRNKQARKVYTVRKDIFVSIIDTGKIEVRVMTPDGHVSFFYSSFDEMLNDWEEYKPAEPLIKDEKIRKAVRAWAETNGREKLLVIKMVGWLEISDGSPNLIYISFRADEATLDGLDDRTYYTIEELCGEEKE